MSTVSEPAFSGAAAPQRTACEPTACEPTEPEPTTGEPSAAVTVGRPGSDTGLGLMQLALTLVRLIHELLERQAIRRLENGTLSDEELERVGATLMQQAEELERLCAQTGIDPQDLNLDLGPLGKLL